MGQALRQLSPSSASYVRYAKTFHSPHLIVGAPWASLCGFTARTRTRFSAGHWDRTAFTNTYGDRDANGYSYGGGDGNGPPCHGAVHANGHSDANGH